MITQLKLPVEIFKNITFHWVHHIESKYTNNRPWQIIEKFENFKQNERVKWQGRQLKGTDYGINDQYPWEILQRWKQLLPIQKQLMKEGKK